MQGVLEAALAQILGHPVALSGAGRTDVGVHASGQVVAFQSDSVKNLARLCHSTNSLLREPVAVLEGACLADEDPFHPRYSALSRTYSYFVLDGSGPGEARFWDGRVWCLPDTLDLDLARQAAALFVGEHDFSTFSYKMEKMETRVRRVSRVDVSVQPTPSLLAPTAGPRLIQLSITANGFLRRMVRLVAAAVMEAAMAKRSLKDLGERLQAKDPTRAPHPAPSEGLYLESIHYDPDPFESRRGTEHHTVARLHSSHRFKK